MVKIGYVVTGSKQESQEIAETLVKERLIACANLLGEIESIYWWDSEINKDKEHALIVKTTEKAVEQTKNKIRELHSYENPAILFFDVNQTTEIYQKWIQEEVKK